MKKYLPRIVVILFVASAIHLSYILYTEVEKQLITNQFDQQEIYAKQAALSIENFFENFKHSLEFIANEKGIIDFNKNSVSILQNFYEAHNQELKAITKVSATGKIVYTFPYVKSVIGKDISDQKHNAEIIKKHKPVISDVLTTVQGYRAIVYAYPIFKNGKYDGCISLVIPFDYIANKFLKDIKFGETGSSFVISEKGIELFCPITKHVGNSIFKNTEGFKNIGNLASQMLSNEEGRGEYYYNRNNVENEIVKKIAVFSRANLENTFWSIAVIVSVDEVLKASRGFVRKLLVLLLLVTVFISLLFYYITRQKRKARIELEQREAKYKAELEKLVEVRTEELKKLNESLKNDIAARKQIEIKLKKAVEKVEKSEKIKSEFLAQMSHEIRTPINTILSFSTLIKEELAQYANDELKYGFSGIQSAGKRLIRTIDLILNMSDVQLGTHEYIPKEVDICEDIIEPLIIEYRVMVNEKGLKLNLLKNTNDTKIVVDSYSVHQIFANLIDNAIKYTREGKIDVECIRNNQGHLEVSVIDTGMGISQDYIPMLFDEFSQEDMGYTRKFEGNGLGLALVKRYCELNKAEIKVESEKGVGTKFTIVFNNNKT